ncbi:unnamed protein product [Owenia fusiformis]|uniref:Uncharacterized protein n=1 Tax=Owenia fusiformis TaxID=6347 RepID=A0A8J1XFB0_OWEFU|nr:unnamed protein product [Owenia fusiformis]
MADSQDGGESDELYELESLGEPGDRAAGDREPVRADTRNTVGHGRDFHFGNRTTVNINSTEMHCPSTPQLIRENQRLKTELEAEQRKHETTKDTLTNITSHLMRELEKNKDLEKKNKELLASVRALQNQLSKLTQKTKKQQEQNRAEIAQLKQEGENLRQTVQELQQTLANERSQHLSKLEESQKMMMNLIQQNATEIKKIAESKRTLWQLIKDFFKKKKKMQSENGGTICQPTDAACNIQSDIVSMP